MKFKKIKIYLLLLSSIITLQAQNNNVDYKLPGKGLNQHPFLYAGEWDTRHPEAQSLFMVRDGKVVFKYSIPMRNASNGIQEFDDATLLSNGNIAFACMSGAGIITPDKKIVWKFDCPPKTECHSCQPIGKNKVLIALNGTPAKLLIIDTEKDKVLKEILIPTTTTNSHIQFRHVRMTKKGTIIVPLKGENRVAEYTQEGKEIWTVPAKSVWAAVRLNNGNTLLSGDGEGYTREVNMKGETVWELTRNDVPFKIGAMQTANRLANGNTVISNWIAGNKNTAEWAGTVQVFEVTPDKKIVWALSAWDNPDLGPATSIQLLDEPGKSDRIDSGR